LGTSSDASVEKLSLRPPNVFTFLFLELICWNILLKRPNVHITVLKNWMALTFVRTQSSFEALLSATYVP
jgi:hypothetical protein